MSVSEMPVLYYTHPQSLTALIRLCRAHPEVIVTGADALEVNCCSEGIRRFIAKYLGGRDEISLPELVPFIHSDHGYWYEVRDTILEALRRQELVTENWQSVQWLRIKPPKRKRLVSLVDVELPDENDQGPTERS